MNSPILYKKLKFSFVSMGSSIQIADDVLDEIKDVLSATDNSDMSSIRVVKKILTTLYPHTNMPNIMMRDYCIYNGDVYHCVISGNKASIYKKENSSEFIFAKADVKSYILPYSGDEVIIDTDDTTYSITWACGRVRIIFIGGNYNHVRALDLGNWGVFMNDNFACDVGKKYNIKKLNICYVLRDGTEKVVNIGSLVGFDVRDPKNITREDIIAGNGHHGFERTYTVRGVRFPWVNDEDIILKAPSATSL